MMFGYLLINYDIKPLIERPKPVWIGKTMVPPQASLEVRRRKV